MAAGKRSAGSKKRAPAAARATSLSLKKASLKKASLKKTSKKTSLKKKPGRKPGKKKASRKGYGGRPTNESRGLGKATSHRPREKVVPSKPLHLTIRLVEGLPSLRQGDEWEVLRESFLIAQERNDFRLCHYSVMPDHLHLIVEADDRGALSRGMQSLQIRVSRRLNRIWRRSGRVFKDRYHAEPATTPEEMRGALIYVLNNARRHSIQFDGAIDPYASGGWFDGWREKDQIEPWPDKGRLVERPRSRLLRGSWRNVEGKGKESERHPGLDPREVPTPKD